MWNGILEGAVYGAIDGAAVAVIIFGIAEKLHDYLLNPRREDTRGQTQAQGDGGHTRGRGSVL